MYVEYCTAHRLIDPRSSTAVTQNSGSGTLNTNTASEMSETVSRLDYILPTHFDINVTALVGV